MLFVRSIWSPENVKQGSLKFAQLRPTWSVVLRHSSRASLLPVQPVMDLLFSWDLKPVFLTPLLGVADPQRLIR